MFNVCPGCGQYSDEKRIDESADIAVCNQCSYEHHFKRLPLFVITGASCVGKSTVALQLPDRLPSHICLESDILWCDAFNDAQGDFTAYRNLWLRVVKNINQSGRPVVLIGSAAPGQFEICAESRYLSAIHYLALVCDDEELERRLKARPAWRKSGDQDVVERMLEFNRWLKERPLAGGAFSRLDTSSISIAESLDGVCNWVGQAMRK
jgi:hypothetical protein